MPVGYLITVTLVAIGTWCALRPVPWVVDAVEAFTAWVRSRERSRRA
ncbi:MULTISPECIES: hypothetical protein [Streptomyces]|nr:hypothetical protein [Streptomyces sp. CL12-4]MCG8968836.1 hypothetical protein [Streptomyces sp. CL12-4]